MGFGFYIWFQDWWGETPSSRRILLTIQDRLVSLDTANHLNSLPALLGPDFLEYTPNDPCNFLGVAGGGEILAIEIAVQIVRSSVETHASKS